MLHQIKSILRQFVPPIAFNSLNAIKALSKNSPRYIYPSLDGNSAFKNIHKGQRCFILASGPSISSQDLKPLADHLCIAVSHFCLHKDIDIIKPKYHILAPQHPPFDFKDSGKYFSSIQKAYSNSDIDIFAGINDYQYSYQHLLNAQPNLQPQRMHYLLYDGRAEIDDHNYLDPEIWDISKPLFSPRTVIYCAIQLAAYLGCSEIVLLGCDHDYLHDINRVENHHFYSDSEGISDKIHLSSFNSELWFKEYYLRWKQYRHMKDYLHSQNISIFNATNGGMLDVFPRISLEELLK